MSWSIGYDDNWKRDIGYGVPATCDHPGCGAEINRGLSYVCGGDPYGGEHGCGLYFCASHLWYALRDGAFVQLCERCNEGGEPFTPTADTQEWVSHKLTDPSWEAWRQEQE
jgi:hypothetical protein